VLAFSGGSALIGSARGDSVWLFGLDGTLSPVPAGAPVSRQVAAATTPVNLVEGRRLFVQSCAVCHGDDGKGGHTGGAPLDRVRDLAAAIQTVTEGRNNMPAFRAGFTPEQIRDVSVYVVQTLAGR
jgi:cytochrome c6